MTESSRIQLRIELVDSSLPLGSRVAGFYNTEDEQVGEAVEYWSGNRIEWFIKLKAPDGRVGRFYLRPLNSEDIDTPHGH